MSYVELEFTQPVFILTQSSEPNLLVIWSLKFIIGTMLKLSNALLNNIIEISTFQFDFKSYLYCIWIVCIVISAKKTAKYEQQVQ